MVCESDTIPLSEILQFREPKCHCVVLGWRIVSRYGIEIAMYGSRVKEDKYRALCNERDRLQRCLDTYGAIGRKLYITKVQKNLDEIRDRIAQAHREQHYEQQSRSN